MNKMSDQHRLSENTRNTSRAILALTFLVAAACSGDGPTGPASESNDSQTCAVRADFGPPAESPYILPYPAGQSYRVSQGYCYPFGGHRNQLAYDFQIPIGDDVIAARSGVVVFVRDDVPDDGTGTDSQEHNDIYIEHSDGTVAFYAHLQQNSVVVNVGEQVSAGQRVAASGNSGNTGGLPHLHFGVYESWPPVEGRDLPVNFRNAQGPTDPEGGLAHGGTYLALPN